VSWTTYSLGVSCPKAPCGRWSLKSCFQTSSLAFASASDKHCTGIETIDALREWACEKVVFKSTWTRYELTLS
jgi:hypothetical protein